MKIEEPIPWMEKFSSLKKLWSTLLLFLLVMGESIWDGSP